MVALRSEPKPKNSRTNFGEWVLACSVAEAMGIAIVSVTYASIDRSLLTNAVMWILFAGAWEGLWLGAAQAFFLRKKGINPALWIGPTVTGAIAGYAMSLLAGAGAEDAGSAYDPPLWMMALLGAGAGLGMGAVMGLIQMPALHGRLSGVKWVFSNAIGWMPAMAVIMASAGLAERT